MKTTQTVPYTDRDVEQSSHQPDASANFSRSVSPQPGAPAAVQSQWGVTAPAVAQFAALASARKRTIRPSATTFSAPIESERQVAEPQAGLIRHEILPQRQKRPNACGDTCANILLNWHGKEYSPAGTNDRPMLSGTTINDLLPKFTAANLSIKGCNPKSPKQYSGDEILKNLRYGPMLACLRGHVVVITGYDASSRHVNIHCPLLGSRVSTLKDLNKHLNWEGSFGPLLAVSPNGFFEDSKSRSNEAKMSSGNIREPKRADKVMTGVLTRGYKLANSSWLRSPKSFQHENASPHGEARIDLNRVQDDALRRILVGTSASLSPRVPQRAVNAIERSEHAQPGRTIETRTVRTVGDRNRPSGK